MLKSIKKHKIIYSIVVIAFMINLMVTYSSYEIIAKSEKIEKQEIKIETVKQKVPIIIEIPLNGECENKDNIIIENIK